MLSPFLTLDCSCNQALRSASETLRKKGLRVLQTFDLHNASHPFDDCPCPHHTTSNCDCQMVVLLVYGELAEPATLILHGNNGTTWVSIPDTVLQPVNAQLITKIRKALEGLVAAEP